MLLSRPWYLYIVENRLDQFYTGICTDLKRRFSEHQSGGPKCAKALKGKGPISLKYKVQLNSHSEALKAELWVKKQSHAQKIALMSGDIILPFEHQKIAAQNSTEPEVAKKSGV